MEIINYLKANNGNSASYYTLWDVKNPRAVVQIITGMSDYIDRYDHLAHFLNKQNILVIGHDHLGQGKAVNSNNELGNLINPLEEAIEIPEIVTRSNRVSLACKKFYPNLPLIVIGHSLGSMIVTELLRNNSVEYGAAILLGIIAVPTITQYISPFIHLITQIENKKLARIINKSAYNIYNQDFNSSNRFSWVTTDALERRLLQLDPLIGYDYTINSWQLILDLATAAATDKWLEYLSAAFPLLIMSGSLDPAGNYGLRLDKFKKNISSQNLENAETKLYYEMQHELLFDQRHEEVFQQISNFINRSLINGIS